MDELFDHPKVMETECDIPSNFQNTYTHTISRKFCRKEEPGIENMMMNGK